MTTTAPALTVADLVAMTRDDRWEGFGYLGERRNVLANGEEGKGWDAEALVADVDAVVVELANEAGLTAEDLFTWANSKLGRWFGDYLFGGAAGTADRVDEARRARVTPRIVR